MHFDPEKFTRIAQNRRNIHHHEIAQPVKSRINFEKDASPAFSVLRPPGPKFMHIYPFWPRDCCFLGVFVA